MVRENAYIIRIILNIPLLLWLAAGAWARGPYVVDASSLAAQVCWRGSQGDACLSLSGLVPGATAAYPVPGRARPAVLRALPADGAPVRIAAFGDCGDGSRGQRAV